MTKRDIERIDELRRRSNQLAMRLNELGDYGRNPNPPPEYDEVKLEMEKIELEMMDINPFYKQCFYITAKKYGRI